MARSLAERLRAHEQSKARLAEVEAKLKLDERKQRTRRLVEAGALVEKTGLLELDSNALYGALLSLRDGAADTKKVEQWATLGGRTFAREGLCCTGQWGPQCGLLASLLREADVVRAPEFEHPVQCVDGNRDLGRSTLIGA